jgi:hypothetical protein
MGDLTPIAPRLGRLIPRLASDKDGEVLATVAAIRRQLTALGLDLHDLAAALESQPEPRRYGVPDWTPTTWREAARWLAEADQGQLSQREREFVDAMRRWRSKPSERQLKWLHDLIEREGAE